MEISRNKVVSFHYELRDGQGAVLEDNFNDTPSLYMHGADNIISGLEKAMSGHTVGDEFEVTLPPEDAYGNIEPNKSERIPAKYLKHEGKIKVGQAVRFNTDKGMRNATVIKVGKFSVDVDLNHPLAGQTLTFKILIKDIRDATDEEIRHRHAHGEGGHQH
ncbi:FKBP-type peptidyl-prolyl cis-trans isomerase [Zhongshania sp. BJYM1]|uniref:FKBP-type peptidyl-prolyl cis-trans isomerase n=1 Tax=Zhongshania aquatica TaxID=2965069 RepID=UPI0022B4F4FE|nr:peptidylprolyl isomerase [Marortus sp. BJYM1]